MNKSEWALLKYVVAKSGDIKAGQWIRDVLMEECEPFREQFEQETGTKVDRSEWDKKAAFARVGTAAAKSQRKFTKDDVLEMDFLRFKRGLTFGQIANKYKISRSTVISVVYRETYKEIPYEGTARPTK